MLKPLIIDALTVPFERPKPVAVICGVPLYVDPSMPEGTGVMINYSVERARHEGQVRIVWPAGVVDLENTP